VVKLANNEFVWFLCLLVLLTQFGNY